MALLKKKEAIYPSCRPGSTILIRAQMSLGVASTKALFIVYLFLFSARSP